MCGATAQQTTDSAAQDALFATLTQEAQKNYGEDQGILSQFQAAYSPTIAAGPNQEGFNQQEKTALQTQADTGVAGNYQQAAQALRESQAARGGDDQLPSGVNDEENEQLAAGAAGQRSTEENQITEADYAQGNANYNTASQDLLGASGQLNPNGYGSTAVSSGTAASNSANQIAQENESWLTPVLGSIGAIGGGLAGRDY